MAAGGEDRLTDAHIAHLAASISTKHLESVAIRYFGIDIETIKSLRDQHRENLEALNRDIFQKWANKNSGSDQIKVIHFTEHEYTSFYLSIFLNMFKQPKKVCVKKVDT